MADSPNIVLSKDGVREEWEAIRAAKVALARREEAFAGLSAYLRAHGHADWIPVELAPAASNSNKGKAPATQGTWTSEIMMAIVNQPDGLELKAIRNILAKGVLAERLKANVNGFYNGVARLEATGEAVRYKGRLFTKQNMESFLNRLQAGEVEDFDDEDTKPFIERIIDVVAARPGIEAREVVRAMVGASNQSVYNNLSKAVAKNKLRRDGSRYFPLKENDPPTGNAGSGSETGEAGTSLFDSRT